MLYSWNLKNTAAAFSAQAASVNISWCWGGGGEHKALDGTGDGVTSVPGVTAASASPQLGCCSQPWSPEASLQRLWGLTVSRELTSLDKKQLVVGEIEVKGRREQRRERCRGRRQSMGRRTRQRWGRRKKREGPGRRLRWQSCLKNSFALENSESRLGCV